MREDTGEPRTLGEDEQTHHDWRDENCPSPYEDPVSNTVPLSLCCVVVAVIVATNEPSGDSQLMARMVSMLAYVGSAEAEDVR